MIQPHTVTSPINASQEASGNAPATADAIPAVAVPAAGHPDDAVAIDQSDAPLEADADADAGEPGGAVSPSPAPVPVSAQTVLDPDAPPASILYCVPANILDVTSGAALSQRSLMIALSRLGLKALALEATIFDSPQGGEHVMKAAEQQKDKKLLRTVTDGLEHLIVVTKARRRGEMTCGEQETYLQVFRDQLRRRRPEMVFMWGGMLLEMTLMREAREAGIPVIFYLVNGGYKNGATFRYVSTVVTDTQATADLYRERLGLNCKVVGKFIDPALVKPKVPRRPDFITFINPSFEKGVSLFMPLAKLAAREAPEIKFLVVQSRGRWGNALGVLKFQPQDFPNVKVIGHQTDMRPVYASTRALLLPSLWHESGARVIAEAQINGIPVIGSNTGGSAELIGAGGVLFDVPAEYREKKTVPVPEDVVRPWLEAIKRVWHEADHYNDLCQKVEVEARQHDIEGNARRFLQAVTPAVQQGRRLRAAHAAKLAQAAQGKTPAKIPGNAAAPAATPAGALRAALDKKMAAGPAARRPKRK